MLMWVMVLQSPFHVESSSYVWITKKKKLEIGLKDWKMLRIGNILSLISTTSTISQECVIGIPVHTWDQCNCMLCTTDTIIICTKGFNPGSHNMYQELATFFCKRPESNYFRVCRPYMVSVAYFSLLYKLSKNPLLVKDPYRKKHRSIGHGLVHRPQFTNPWQLSSGFLKYTS